MLAPILGEGDIPRFLILSSQVRAKGVVPHASKESLELVLAKGKDRMLVKGREILVAKGVEDGSAKLVQGVWLGVDRFKAANPRDEGREPSLGNYHVGKVGG